jgi:hypothetical protein
LQSLHINVVVEFYILLTLPHQTGRHPNPNLIQFRSNLMPHIPLPSLLPSTVHLPKSHTRSLVFHPLALPHISLLAPLPPHPPLARIVGIELRVQSFSESLDVPKVMDLRITLPNAVFKPATTAGRRRRMQDFPGVGALPGSASFEDDEEGV